MRKAIVLTAVALLMFFVVSGQLFASGGKESDASKTEEVTTIDDGPRYGGRIIYSSVSEIETIDEHFAQQLVTQGVLSNVYEGLVGHDEYLNLKPQLATSWDISEDARTYTFHLRKGVKFHHGREMEAKDVKFSIERVLNPENAASNRAALVNIEEVEIVDKYTVEFHLKNSDAAFPAKLSQQTTIMPHDVTKAVGRIEIGDTISGTGPFTFVEWKKDDYTLFKKFDDYWVEGLPYVDEVMIKIIPDANVRLAALRAGDIDIMEWIPPEQLETMMKNPPENLVVKPAPFAAETAYVCFNTLEPPFNDKKVRQAFAYAIDKDAIVQGAWRGIGETCLQPWNRNSVWYVDMEDVYREPNPGMAKKLLTEAGYPDGLDITWSTTSGIPYMLSLAQVCQENLRKAGIRVKIDIYDWPSYTSKMSNMEFILWNTGVPGKSEPAQWYPLVHKEGAVYHWIGGKYINTELVNLIDEMEQVADMEVRQDIHGKILEILQEEVPILYTSLGPIGFAWNKRIQGFTPHMITYESYVGGGLAYTWIVE